eukprot:9202720-Prorocentrum_lima.AAC.1
MVVFTLQLHARCPTLLLLAQWGPRLASANAHSSRGATPVRQYPDAVGVTRTGREWKHRAARGS